MSSPGPDRSPFQISLKCEIQSNPWSKSAITNRIAPGRALLGESPPVNETQAGQEGPDDPPEADKYTGQGFLLLKRDSPDLDQSILGT